MAKRIPDQTVEFPLPGRPLVASVHKAKDGWRWTLESNGRIIAESGEAYHHRTAALRGLELTAGLSTAEFAV